MHPLSVALLTRGFVLPRWQAERLQLLQSGGLIEVTGIVGVGSGAGSGALERLCCAVQDALEHRKGHRPEPLAALLDARATFPRARAILAGGGDADLAVS